MHRKSLLNLAEIVMVVSREHIINLLLQMLFDLYRGFVAGFATNGNTDTVYCSVSVPDYGFFLNAPALFSVCKHAVSGTQRIPFATKRHSFAVNCPLTYTLCGCNIFLQNVR